MANINPNAGSVFGPAMADVWGVTTKKRKRKQAQRDERIQSDYEARHGGSRTNAKSLHPEVAAVAPPLAADAEAAMRSVLEQKG